MLYGSSVLFSAVLATTDLYKNLKRIEKENRDDNAASSLTLSRKYVLWSLNNFKQSGSF